MTVLNASRQPKRRNGIPTSLAGSAFEDANRRRIEIAASRTVIEARESIAVLLRIKPPKRSEAMHQRYLAALRERVQYPDKSLAEVAAIKRVTKDTYSCRLRRALEYAARLKGFVS